MACSARCSLQKEKPALASTSTQMTSPSTGFADEKGNRSSQPQHQRQRVAEVSEILRQGEGLCFFRQQVAAVKLLADRYFGGGDTCREEFQGLVHLCRSQ